MELSHKVFWPCSIIWIRMLFNEFDIVFSLHFEEKKFIVLSRDNEAFCVFFGPIKCVLDNPAFNLMTEEDDAVRITFYKV